MRRPIVAGNWKMHGSRSETARLIEELLAGAPANAPGPVTADPGPEPVAAHSPLSP